jgi:predicted O-methyltransferase YrrM
MGDKYQHMGITELEADILLSYLPKNGILVEIGTYFGETAAYLAEKCPSAMIISVDPFPKREDAVGWIGSYHNWFENKKRNNFLLVGTSDTLIAMSGEEWADVVLIDGCHEYKSVKVDLENVCSIVKRDGVVAAHDYDRSDKLEKMPGVAKAVNESEDYLLIKTVGTMAILNLV